MAYPKYHGIRLADNSAIENAVIERLAADPAAAAPGRVWFNDTEKKLKFSSLDAGGGVVVEVFGTEAELDAYIALNDAALAAEATTRGAADTAASTRMDGIDDDVVDGVAEAKAYADNKISEVVAAAPEALDTLKEIADYIDVNPNANIADAITAQVNAAKDELRGTVTAAMDTFGEVETKVNTNHTLALDAVSAEQTRAMAAEGVNATAIASLEGQVGGNTGSLADLTTDAKTTLVAAINEVDGHADDNASGLAAEITNRGNAVTAVQGNLDDYETSNDAALAAEVVARGTSDGNLSGSAFDATKNDLTKAVNGVQDAVAAETTRATAAETSEAGTRASEITRVEGLVSDETTARTAAIDAETLRAETAEGGLQGQIDNVKSNLDPAALDSLTEIVTAFQDADSDLNDAITTTLGTHTSELADEVSRATAAEGVNAAAISSEETRATNAEGVLQTNIDNENTRATTAEAGLQTNIDAEATTRGTEITRVEGLVTAEAASRTTADDQIRTDVNGMRASYQSPAAGVSHTVAHSLNSSFISVDVWVEGDDGLYRNDIVAIEEVDGNTVRVDLTESRKVKVAVVSMGDI